MTKDDVARIDAALRTLRSCRAPPPSPRLEAAVLASSPVAHRSPWRAYASVVAASVTALGLHLHAVGLRRDLGGLAASATLPALVAWGAAWLVPLAIVLVPTRGSVFPDTTRAIGAAAVAPLAALVLSLLLGGAAALPASASIASVLLRAERCWVDGLEMAWIPFAAGVFALRQAPLPASTLGVGAALGAANGALAALMLQVRGFTGTLESLVALGGIVAIGAVVGAFVVPRVADARP